MKKFIALALIGLGCVGVCVVYTQDETVKELVGKLHQFPQRAAEWCPQLCTLQAVDENIEAAVCGFCYESCPSGGMMAQCQNKNYAQPLKRAKAQVSIYEKAMEQLAKRVRVYSVLLKKYNAATKNIKNLEDELLTKAALYDKVVMDLMQGREESRKDVSNIIETIKGENKSLRSQIDTLERENKQLQKSSRLIKGQEVAAVAQCKKLAMEYFKPTNRNYVGLLQIMSWIFDMGGGIGGGEILEQQKLQLKQAEDSLGYLIKHGAQQSDNKECQKILQSLRGLESAQGFLTLNKIATNIGELYAAANKKSPNWVADYYPRWVNVNLSLIEIILKSQNAINAVALFTPQEWESVRPEENVSVSMYDTINSWRMSTKRLLQSKKGLSKIGQIFLEQEKAEEECRAVIKKLIVPEGELSLFDLYTKLKELYDASGEVLTAQDMALLEKIIKRFDQWEKLVEPFNGTECYSMLNDIFLKVPKFDNYLELREQLRKFIEPLKVDAPYNSYKLRVWENFFKKVLSLVNEAINEDALPKDFRQYLPKVLQEEELPGERLEEGSGSMIEGESPDNGSSSESKDESPDSGSIIIHTESTE